MILKVTLHGVHHTLQPPLPMKNQRLSSHAMGKNQQVLSQNGQPTPTSSQTDVDRRHCFSKLLPL